MKLNKIFFGLLFLCLSVSVSAEERVLFDESELTFEPVEVLYFVGFDTGDMYRVKGKFLVPKKQIKEGVFTVLSSALINLTEKQKRVSSRVLFVGKDRKFSLVVPKDREAATLPHFQGVTDGLREFLLKRKELLKSWEVQVQTQDQALGRLREDANVIGNLSRILEVKEELERENQNSEMLKRDIESLKEFLRIAKIPHTPKNYVVRESQLTRHIAELARAAKEAEAQEVSRRNREQGDMQRRLALIEQTRNDNIDELQKTLAQLKKGEYSH